MSNYRAWILSLQMLGGLGSLTGGTFMTYPLRNGTRQDVHGLGALIRDTNELSVGK